MRVEQSSVNEKKGDILTAIKVEPAISSNAGQGEFEPMDPIIPRCESTPAPAKPSGSPPADLSEKDKESLERSRSLPSTPSQVPLSSLEEMKVEALSSPSHKKQKKMTTEPEPEPETSNNNNSSQSQTGRMMNPTEDDSRMEMKRSNTNNNNNEESLCHLGTSCDTTNSGSFISTNNTGSAQDSSAVAKDTGRSINPDLQPPMLPSTTPISADNARNNATPIQVQVDIKQEVQGQGLKSSEAPATPRGVGVIQFHQQQQQASTQEAAMTPSHDKGKSTFYFLAFKFLAIVFQTAYSAFRNFVHLLNNLPCQRSVWVNSYNQ